MLWIILISLVLIVFSCNLSFSERYVYITYIRSYNYTKILINNVTLDKIDGFYLPFFKKGKIIVAPVDFLYFMKKKRKTYLYYLIFENNVNFPLSVEVSCYPKTELFRIDPFNLNNMERFGTTFKFTLKASTIGVLVLESMDRIKCKAIFRGYSKKHNSILETNNLTYNLKIFYDVILKRVKVYGTNNKILLVDTSNLDKILEIKENLSKIFYTGLDPRDLLKKLVNSEILISIPLNKKMIIYAELVPKYVSILEPTEITPKIAWNNTFKSVIINPKETKILAGGKEIDKESCLVKKVFLKDKVGRIQIKNELNEKIEIFSYDLDNIYLNIVCSVKILSFRHENIIFNIFYYDKISKGCPVIFYENMKILNITSTKYYERDIYYENYYKNMLSKIYFSKSSKISSVLILYFDITREKTFFLYEILKKTIVPLFLLISLTLILGVSLKRVSE